MNDKELPKRKNIRLKGYDYSQNGMYFITICVKDKKHLLAHYKSNKFVGAGLRARPQDALIMTPLGREVEKSIWYINEKYNDISVVNAIVMPNHIHLLILYDNITGGHGDPPLQDLIRNLKSFTTKRYWEICGDKTSPLWQRRYMDHIIRNQTDFEYHWNYIEYNALKEYPLKDEKI